jgi:hypothetical protein
MLGRVATEADQDLHERMRASNWHCIRTKPGFQKGLCLVLVLKTLHRSKVSKIALTQPIERVYLPIN